MASFNPVPTAELSTILETDISMQDLKNLIAAIAQNINTLTTNVNAFISRLTPAATINFARLCSLVEKSEAFDSKSLEKAHMFQSLFCVYACSNKELFTKRNANDQIVLNATDNWVTDSAKMISSVLSFLIKEAAV